MSRAIIIGLLLAVCSAIVIAQAQETPTPKAPDQPQKQNNQDFTLSVDVELVQLPISVLDVKGRPVDGLTKDQFQVFEDNTLQQIKLFKHEDIPLSLGLVIDNSGSMRNKRERVNSAALSFVRESNPEDETFIVNFDDSAYLEQDFTGSIGDLIDALDNLDTRGETALYDAVYLSVDHVKAGKKDKKAILLISDGEDNVSKYGFNKVVEALRESKVTLYAIGLLEDNDQRGGLFKKPPSKKAKENLERFAEITGGQAYFPKSLDEVEELVKDIAHDLRNHYTIGYTPTNRKMDGAWREIRVKVNPPKNVSKVSVRSKQGYYAPTAEPVSSNR
jgi:Ca-activated chloride channel homolog